MSGSTAAVRTTPSAWTQCYISVGDPDGEDFAFTYCNADGTFTIAGLPAGNWRLTTFDEWNDMLVDGLSTPGRPAGSTPGTAELLPRTRFNNGYVCDMGDMATEPMAGQRLHPHLHRREQGRHFAIERRRNSVDQHHRPLPRWQHVQQPGHRLQRDAPTSTRRSRCSTGTWWKPTPPATRPPVSTPCTMPAVPRTVQHPCGQPGYPACGNSTIGKFLAKHQ